MSLSSSISASPEVTSDEVTPDEGGSGVAEVYNQRPGYQWRRLDAMPCEFHIHLSTILDELPSKSRVLDIGAGPGRYAVELARAGHRVTAGDISPAMLELARQHVAEAGYEPGGDDPQGGGIDAVLELDACDLGRFEDNSFDGVVALGPFYHLAEAVARRRAAAEVSRVVRPGGLLFAAFKPRTFWLSLALHSFVTSPDAPDAQLEQLERFLDDGRLTKVRSEQLKHSWFCRVEEIEEFFAPHAIRRRRLLASSGVAALWSRPGTWQRFNERHPALRDRLLELVRQTAEDPHVLGMSDQVLFVGEVEEPEGGHNDTYPG